MMAQGKAGIEGSWAGGETGTRLVDELIDGHVIRDVLASQGRFYLVAIKQNDPAGLVKRLIAQGLDADVSSRCAQKGVAWSKCRLTHHCSHFWELADTHCADRSYWRGGPVESTCI